MAMIDDMSLRDWFAGCAEVASVFGFLDKENSEKLVGRPRPEDFAEVIAWHFDVIAALKYMAADAMLAARNVQGEEAE